MVGAQAGEDAGDCGAGGVGRCEYGSCETIAGLGAWLVALVMGKQLDEADRRYGEDLKRVLESKMRGNGD